MSANKTPQRSSLPSAEGPGGGEIRVVLADDHTVVRQGLRSILESEPDIRVVGEAENGRQALQLTLRLHPHVVILDIAMPKMNGLEATRQILRNVPGTAVLVLSAYSDDDYVHQVGNSGASGYLLKHADAGDLVTAVREVRNGNAFLSPKISKRLLSCYRGAFLPERSEKGITTVLTSRETEVLQLIAEGRGNKGIADELSISIKTVEKHRQQVMTKLEIHGVAGLTRHAISKGIIEGRLVSRV